MIFVCVAIMAGCLWVGYETGRASERQRVNQELQKAAIFGEQLEADRKRVIDETKRQLKFEADERKKIRKQIEDEERST